MRNTLAFILAAMALGPSLEYTDNAKRVAHPEIGIDFIWVQTREP